MAKEKEKVERKAPLKVMRCRCPSQFQDRRFGQGMRVHNLAPGNDGRANRYRCAVCSTLRTSSGEITK